MRRYAVLNGFGLFDESKMEYKKYLDRFVKFIDKNRIDEVVLCGGRTNPAMPDKSEAGTMAEYLAPKIGNNVKIDIEDASITTTQNLRLAKRFIDLSPENTIFVVADAVRFAKVMWIILSDWFALDRRQAIDYWIDFADKVYLSPNHKGNPLRLKDIGKGLRYKNVRVVVDRLHKKYNEAFHTLLTEPLEIEALYDKEIEAKYDGFSMRKFGLKP